MVHIKKLEVYGFKSFGFRNTVVNFEKGLVAVTGPNGSGKSNILDAIMFAIGETSTKLLRVEKMQSLFHDSNNSSHRLVRVSLTFDNSDRGIPVDSDTVTLTREMEGHNGESKYLLNGKAVAKATIMELLEVVLAAPNKLNIVQQGMITRISELTSEDRRRIIEDIVGLSYFDEKKAESIKQLDEADRRLEVAFARMGEIRKRIDELEAERNDQLRYDQISQELKRFKGVQLSNNIRRVRQKLESGNSILQSNTDKSASFWGQLEEIRRQMDSLQGEKEKFMKEVDAANRAKAQMESKVAVVVHDLERNKAMQGENDRRLAQIELKLPTLGSNRKAIEARLKNMNEEVWRLKSDLDQKKSASVSIKSQLDIVNSEIENIAQKAAKYASRRQKLDRRLARMGSLKANIELAANAVEERLKNADYRSRSNEQSATDVMSKLDAARRTMQELSEAVEQDRARLQDAGREIATLTELKALLERELEGSIALYSKAEKLAVKFEERASVAKSAMNEDFAIADLMKGRENFGILGLVHDLVKWNADYERAVLAAGADWMKAFVVSDIKAMVLIAGYAKERRLPRLRIIPLDMISRHKQRIQLPDDVNVIGRLSDFVYSDYNATLPLFLFSETILTRNSSSAYLLARQGYKAVSVDGELFEPQGGSMSLDFGSRISDLTKAILLGDSVGELKDMLGRLLKTIEAKRHEVKGAAEKIALAEADQVRVGLRIESTAGRIAEANNSIAHDEKLAGDLESSREAMRTEREKLVLDLAGLKRRLELLGPALSRMQERVNAISDEGTVRSELAERNVQRNQLNKALDGENFALSQLSSSLSGIESRLENDTRQLREMEEEKVSLEQELEHRRKLAGEYREKASTLEASLKELRDQEQQVIGSSGQAYSVLQDYDRKLKEMAESERRLSREHGGLERESAVLRKDISNLSSEDSRLTNDLAWLGYKSLLDEMDVQIAIKELTDEFEAVKSKINLRADESYVQVMEGYRGMSSRKNQLENERNSIVSFIQHIEKEKKDVFMEAFQRVNSDIQSTFEKMTGGEARLEIENPEDVFSSGVMLLVRFPNKTVSRESTALSGGEKTIAATVFLLALQSLKPSPFYLMDEVDAHLDAQNTERLAKVLLERSKDNQIIMVTLKDSTVAKAALIYGVYPREGASQVVKYKNPAQVPLAQIASSETK